MASPFPAQWRAVAAPPRLTADPYSRGKQSRRKGAPCTGNRRLPSAAAPAPAGTRSGTHMPHHLNSRPAGLSRPPGASRPSRRRLRQGWQWPALCMGEVSASLNRPRMHQINCGLAFGGKVRTSSHLPGQACHRALSISRSHWRREMSSWPYAPPPSFRATLRRPSSVNDLRLARQQVFLLRFHRCSYSRRRGR